MYLAQHWKKTNRGLICQLCSHYCHLKNGESGRCGVRIHQNGSLYCLNYNDHKSIGLDSVEKQSLFHYYPGHYTLSIGAHGNNLKIPDEHYPPPNKENSKVYYHLKPIELINYAILRGLKSLSFTYNEPTVFYEFANETMLLAADNNLKNIWCSNAYISPIALKGLKALNAVNIEILSLKESFYNNYYKAKLKPILNNIISFLTMGVWLEFSTIIIPGINDTLEDIKKLSKFIVSLNSNIPWHINCFHHTKSFNQKQTCSNSFLQKAYDIAKDTGLNYVYSMHLAQQQLDTYCNKCNQRLIARLNKHLIANDILNNCCWNCHNPIAGIW